MFPLSLLRRWFTKTPDIKAPVSTGTCTWVKSLNIPDIPKNGPMSEITVVMADKTYRYLTVAEIFRFERTMREPPAVLSDCELTRIISHHETSTDGLVVYCAVASPMLPDEMLSVATIRFSRLLLERRITYHALSNMAMNLYETAGVSLSIKLLMQLCELVDICDERGPPPVMANAISW